MTNRHAMRCAFRRVTLAGATVLGVGGLALGGASVAHAADELIVVTTEPTQLQFTNLAPAQSRTFVVTVTPLRSGPLTLAVEANPRGDAALLKQAGLQLTMSTCDGQWSLPDPAVAPTCSGQVTWLVDSVALAEGVPVGAQIAESATAPIEVAIFVHLPASVGNAAQSTRADIDFMVSASPTASTPTPPAPTPQPPPPVPGHPQPAPPAPAAAASVIAATGAGPSWWHWGVLVGVGAALLAISGRRPAARASQARTARSAAPPERCHRGELQ